MYRKIISILLFIPLIAFGGNSNEYKLIDVDSKQIYYNFLIYKNTLYVGSDNGIYELENFNLKLYDAKEKGYIRLIDNKIIAHENSLSSDLMNMNYNYLLPKDFQNIKNEFILFKNQLCIISKNTLFIFSKKNYTTKFDTLSLRSFTKNIIGSYGGIFINGVKLQYPSYTDGEVKEIDEYKFICYGGLLQITKNETKDYSDRSSGEFRIHNKNLGLIRDIDKINVNKYVATTNKGIFLFSFNETKIDTILLNKKLTEFNNVFYVENEKRILYFTENKIFIYSLIDKKNILYLDTKENQIIKDIYVQDLKKLYILFDKGLKLYISNSIEFTSSTVLLSNLSSCHNIVLFKDFFCITSNYGVHFYNKKTNEAFINTLNLETNRRAINIIDDTLCIGTTNGIIYISTENLKDIISNRRIIINSDEENAPILYLIIVIVIALIIIIFIWYHKKSEKSKIIEEKNFLITRENIEKYIILNIKNVSIKSICEHFKLSTSQLYEILENEKPGEIIRKQRFNLVRKFRKQRKDDLFISENTGFSLSYLKKIY